MLLLDSNTVKTAITPAQILIVEDEGIVALDIKNHLLDIGYQVIGIAETGKLAVQKALELQPDLILMDIRLKGKMDGIEAAGKITEELDIPIIFLTAFADQDTLEKAKSILPVGYIHKPFDTIDLYTSIEISLQKHQADQVVKQQRKWFSTILESIGDAVIASDNQGLVTFMNRMAESITHWDKIDALGQNIDTVIPLRLSETETSLENPLKQVLREGQQITLPENTLLINKNQELVPIEDSAAPILDDNQNSYGAVIVFRDITKRLSKDHELFHHAYYDILTNLPNRALFMDRLQHLVDLNQRYPNCSFAVLFVDLDRFKLINDSLGHPLGDQLLVLTAQRLQKCLRPTDTVARFGGDEFAILLEQISDAKSAQQLAIRINQELGKPCHLENYDLFNSASIGIVQWHPRYKQAEELIRDADIAMYQAKTNGKACFAVFDAAMHTHVRGQLTLEHELRWAIPNHQLILEYQPIVSLADDREIVGFEALVRWQNPGQGKISPGVFIPIAEETGLIVHIDWWVLRQACSQMKIWQDQLPTGKKLDISVNLSSYHFSLPNVVKRIKKILTDTGFPASSLKLEVTESILIKNPDSVAQILSELKLLGIRIHMDDFGTGYSSLSYLHKYDIDSLKIDRSFIQDIEHSAEHFEIVRTILLLANALKMDAIAEGVETAQQLAAIQSLGCKYVQGYYFSRPLTCEQITTLVSEQRFKASIQDQAGKN